MCSERYSHGAAPFLEALEPRLLLDGSVMISEFMADNDTGLQDADLQYSDWLELHNSGSELVDLTGWTLRDSADIWQLPDGLELAPGEFRVIFCSNGRETVADPKDPDFDGAYLHTNFKLSKGGEYLGLYDDLGVVVHEYDEYPDQFSDISYGMAHSVETTEFVIADDPARYLVPGGDPGAWTSAGFDDSLWAIGDTGIGYVSTIPGFAVRNFKANTALANLGVALQVIDNPAMQSSVHLANPGVINYYESGGHGNYASGESVFPGVTGDESWYVTEAKCWVDIPSAGAWSFGVNSDDGCQLTIAGTTTTAVANSNTPAGGDTISFTGLRADQDTIGAFDFPSAGLYELRLVSFENEGGSSVEMFAAPGAATSFGGTFDLVGDTANGGLAVVSTPSGGGGGAGLTSLIETDVKDVMKGTNASLLTRMSFTIDTAQLLAEIESLTLRMKYDDGFVAYLNGVEIGSRNAPVSPVWNSNATDQRNDAQATAWETLDASAFIDQLVVGANVLAIHGLNYAAGDDDFLILPELQEVAYGALDVHYFVSGSPNEANTQDHWLYVEDTDFSHTRGFYSEAFDLEITSDTEDAEIYYTLDGSEPSETNGTLYSSTIAITGTSVVRARAFKADFEPTNVDTQTYMFLDDIVTQSSDGAYPGGDWPTANVNGQSIVYGMDPDIVGGYNTVDQVKDSLLSIPTISMVTDLANLFDPSIGIIVNANMDGAAWERPGSIEMIYPDGATGPGFPDGADDGFQVEAGIRIRGGYSRSDSNPKHAFRLFFRDEYGDAKLNYALFGDEGTDEFDKVDLRTSQNYSWAFGGPNNNTMVRDIYGRDVQGQLGHEYTRGRYYHLYINGQYWGVFQTDERADESFGESYYGGDAEDYDIVKPDDNRRVIATDGNLEAYYRLWDATANIGYADSTNYYRVQGMNADGSANPAYERLLDVDNIIDYMLITYYTGDRDGPGSWYTMGGSGPNNFFAAYNRENPDGFKFFEHDSEHSLGTGENNMVLRGGELLGDDAVDGWSSVAHLQDRFAPHWLHEQLVNNPDYVARFADRLYAALYNDGPMAYDNSLAQVNYRAAQVDQAMIAESARWGDTKTNPPKDHEDWVTDVNEIRSWISGRSNTVVGQVRQLGWYPSIDPPAFSVNGSSQHGGTIDLGDSLTIAAASGTVYYTLDGSDPAEFGTPYAGAIPLNSSMHVKTRAYTGSEWSALCQAAFYVDLAPDIRITEIMYNPADPSQAEIDEGFVDNDEFEYIEIKNISASETLPLWGLRFSNGVRYTFDNVSVAPGGFVVVARNIAAFNYRYPTFSGTVVGPFDDGMSLSNSGEKIELDSPVGGIIHEFTYKDGWYDHTDGDGFSLTIRDPDAADGAMWDVSEGWRASAGPGGTPGYDDVMTDPGAIIVNEVLAHSDAPFVDTIELYNAGDQPVDISGWFLSDSSVDLTSYQIPAMAPIVPGQYAVFYGDTHFGGDFLLSEHGDDVYLSSNFGGLAGGYRQHVDFGASPNNVSIGLYVKSTGGSDFTLLDAHTFGGANSAPYFEDLVINEVMYNPTDPTAAEILAGYADRDYFEFIEIYNTSTTTTHSLGDYIVSGGVGASFGWYDAAGDGAESWTLEPGATATWDATLAPGSDSYEVFARWDLLDALGDERNLDGQARYAITHDGGTTEVLRDQKPELNDEGPDYIDQFGWVSLGVYTFDGTGSIVLTRGTNNPDNWTIADQVKFVRAGHADVVVDAPTLDSRYTAAGPATIGPGQRVVLVSNYDAFDMRYDIAGSGITVVGEYTGLLANDGEKLKLQRAGTPDPSPSYYIPYYRIDYANYGDAAPWPIEADGAGASLARLRTGSIERYGNDPLSWAPSLHLGTPGDVNDFIDSTPPSAPTDLSAEVSLVPGMQIDLSWTASVEPDSSVDHYIIYRDGTEIGASITESFTDTNVSIATEYSYTVQAVNRDQYVSELSSPIDITIPGLVSYGILSSTEIYLVFSEALDQTSAQLLANYSIDGGASLSTASLSPDNVTVTLTTSELQAAQSYTVTVGSIVTVSGSLMPAGQEINFDYAPSGSGFILREWWTGIAGGAVTDLTSSPSYPDSPTGSDLLTSFEAPIDWADSFGTRIRGYVHPPESGFYTFWISSDDGSDLYLSTNSDPANATRIAFVAGWTNPREWTREANQKSVEIYLTAGQKYYIEALQKEGGGGDNLAVAWQMTGGAFEGPIPGNYLSEIVMPPSLESAVVVGPTQVLVNFTSPVTEASAEDIANYEITYPIGQAVGISAAVWNPAEPTQVILDLSESLVLGSTYTLIVNSVAGPSGVEVDPDSTLPFVYSDSDLPSLWSFNGDSDGFTYSDDVFNNTSTPARALGEYEPSGGYAGGGLKVFLGPGVRWNSRPMSGAWSRTFNAGSGGQIDVSLRFRMIMAQGYETNEFGEVILEIDGLRYGSAQNNSLVHDNGGGAYDTGWLLSTQRVTLTPGDHTITIGAYNNGASASDEMINVYIDDVSLVALDSIPPIADVTDVAPDPRTSGVDEIEIVFSEEITGLDIGDLMLSRDGGGDILTGAETLTSADNITWILGSLATLTEPAGDYTLTLAAVGSGVADLAGNSMTLDASDSWERVSTPPFVVDPIDDVVVDINAPNTVLDVSGAFDDADLGDVLVFSVTNNTNSGLVTPNLAGSDLSLSYASDQLGVADITVRATDADGLWAEDTFTVSVILINDPPVLVNPIADVAVDEDAPDTLVELSNVFDDIDLGDVLSLSVWSNSNPDLVTASIAGTELTLAYASDQSGVAEIIVRAEDGEGEWVEDSFTVTVDPVNDFAPTVIDPILDLTVAENAPADMLDISAVFDDADFADTLTLSIVGNTAPGLVAASLIGGQLTLSYTAAQFGRSQITVRATDSGLPGLWVEDVFDVTVISQNAPLIANPLADLDVTQGSGDTVLSMSDVFEEIPCDIPCMEYVAVEIDPVTGQPASGTGLFAYTFTLYGNDGVDSLFLTTSLTFSGSIQQLKVPFIGTLFLDVDYESDALVRDGYDGYVAALDSWLYDGWSETEPGDTSLSGTTLVLSVFSGTSQYYQQKDLVRIVADGDVQWSGEMSREGVTYGIAGDTGQVGLTLSVEGNTNPGQVTAGIDGENLTVSYAPDFVGSADITIRATDSSGRWIEDTFTVTVTPAAEIVGRRIFYNNSQMDGADPAAGAADDGAIASEKRVMMPGGLPGPVNLSNYWRGINGVMIDIADMSGVPTAADFSVRVGDPAAPGGWIDGPAPSVSVRGGQGTDGSDRVTLIWPDGAIVDQWVEVTVAAAGNIGLVSEDVFYFGNIAGDCNGDMFVGEGDYDVLMSEFGQSGDDLASDFNSDGHADLGDFLIMQDRYGSSLAAPAVQPGDADGSGVADDADLDILRSRFGLAGDDLIGDFDSDGYVGLSDFVILRENFGASLPAASPVAAPGLVTSVNQSKAIAPPINTPTAPQAPASTNKSVVGALEPQSIAASFPPQSITAAFPPPAVSTQSPPGDEPNNGDLTPPPEREFIGVLSGDPSEDLLVDILAETPLTPPLTY
jgi:hypothetical protein